MFSRLARGILSMLSVWCILVVMGTPTVSGWMERAYQGLNNLQSASSGESALVSLMLDEQALQRPACVDGACKAPTVMPDRYRIAQFPGAVFGRAKLVLEPSTTYEAAPGGYLANTPWPGAPFIARSQQHRAADGGVHIMDEVTPSGETKPVFAAEYGYFSAWMGAIDADVKLELPASEGDAKSIASTTAEVALDEDARLVVNDTVAPDLEEEPDLVVREDAEAGAYEDAALGSDGDAEDATGKVLSLKNREVHWRQVVYQPISRPMKLRVTNLTSAVAAGDWVVLYADSSESPSSSRRDLVIGRAGSVTSMANGALIELNTDDESLDEWLATRADLHAAMVQFADAGFLMTSFKPDEKESSFGTQLSTQHEQRLLQNQQIALWSLPESALDRECSADRAPQTACVWLSLAGEAVPVQVTVLDRQAGKVRVSERRLFAGKAITPKAWQGLSTLARRAWLIQTADDGASIFDDGIVLATPWRH